MSEVVALVFAGEYDIAIKQQMRRELAQLIPAPKVVLDFSNVTFIDSTVVAELIRMHRRRAENLFERETIVLGTDNVKRLFGILELNKVFRIVHSLHFAFEENHDQIVIRRAFVCADVTAPPAVGQERQLG